MTAISVFVVDQLPLIRLDSAVTEPNGSALATSIMSAIHFMTENEPKCRRPLSLTAPRLLR